MYEIRGRDESVSEDVLVLEAYGLSSFRHVRLFIMIFISRLASLVNYIQLNLFVCEKRDHLTVKEIFEQNSLVQRKAVGRDHYVISFRLTKFIALNFNTYSFLFS